MNRWYLRIDMRTLVVIIGVIATGLAGCARRAGQMRVGDQLSPPQGLDSAGTVAWIAQQRAACRGQLRLAVDQMPVVSLDGTPVPYHSPIVGVICARP